MYDTLYNTYIIDSKCCARLGTLHYLLQICPTSQFNCPDESAREKGGNVRGCGGETIALEYKRFR